jgi:hypothetical protein
MVAFTSSSKCVLSPPMRTGDERYTKAEPLFPFINLILSNIGIFGKHELKLNEFCA